MSNTRSPNGIPLPEAAQMMGISYHRLHRMVQTDEICYEQSMPGSPILIHPKAVEHYMATRWKGKRTWETQSNEAEHA